MRTSWSMATPLPTSLRPARRPTPMPKSWTRAAASSFRGSSMHTPIATEASPKALETCRAGATPQCRRLDRRLAHDHDKHLSALINAVECREGTTACYDLMFEFPAPTVDGMEAVASAYATVGMRAVITQWSPTSPSINQCPASSTRSPKSRVPGRAGCAWAAPTEPRRVAASRKTWSHPADQLRLAIAPTIPQHCTRDFMIGCRDIAREHGLAMQTHVSESKYRRRLRSSSPGCR